MQLLKQKYWHELFEAGVLVKALNGVWETLGGILFIYLGPNWLLALFRPFAFVSRHLHPIAGGTRTFIIIYLLGHGVINFFLSYNLYRNRLWAYPTSMTFTALILLYQIYRLTNTHSLLLLAISILDVFFIILTWHEYQHQLTKRAASGTH